MATPLRKFDPWIGEKFSSEEVRILVVAESHYRECRPDSDFSRRETNEIIERHGLTLNEGSSQTSFFFKIAQALNFGGAPPAETWRRIAYYNYFQRVMDEPRELPTASDFAGAVEPFDELLRELQPDAVVVMSGRVWEGMANECVRSGECQLGAIYDFTGKVNLRIPGAHTLHPSAPFRQFDPVAWRDRIADFLETVRKRKISGG